MNALAVTTTTEVLFDAPDARAHALGRVVLMAWHRAPRAEVVRAVQDAVRPHGERFPDGVGLVLLPMGDAPDDAGRAALNAWKQSLGGAVAAAAAVIAVGGIKGSVVRGLAAGVVAAMRLPFAVKLVESRAAACEHVARGLREKGLAVPGADELAAALERAATPHA